MEFEHASGYTQKQIDRIWRSLTKGQDLHGLDEFCLDMQIGRWDGCVMQEGDGPTP